MRLRTRLQSAAARTPLSRPTQLPRVSPERDAQAPKGSLPGIDSAQHHGDTLTLAWSQDLRPVPPRSTLLASDCSHYPRARMKRRIQRPSRSTTDAMPVHDRSQSSGGRLAFIKAMMSETDRSSAGLVFSLSSKILSIRLYQPRYGMWELRSRPPNIWKSPYTKS